MFFSQRLKTEANRYWHPSNVLYYYGEPDCPLAEGDFAHAMRLVQEAVTFEMTLWSGENAADDVAHFKAYAAAAEEAGQVWQLTDHDTDRTLALLRARVTKLRTQANSPVEELERANNLELMADALESGDYATLAI